MAGGGTIISFPTLQGLGLSAVSANVTNTVALSSGMLSGTYTQRADLAGQARAVRSLLVVAAAGGLGGSVLLLTIPAAAFRTAVPYLILLACVLLLAQDRLKRLVGRSPAATAGPAITDPAITDPAITDPATATLSAGTGLRLSVFACSVYGGFFGAGLGILLLAVLGLFTEANLVRTNVVKQALAFVINVVAAALFAFSGKVDWVYAALMAVTSIAGAAAGARLVRRVDPRVFRAVVVLVGIAAAVRYWV